MLLPLRDARCSRVRTPTGSLPWIRPGRRRWRQARPRRARETRPFGEHEGVEGRASPSPMIALICRRRRARSRSREGERARMLRRTPERPVTGRGRKHAPPRIGPAAGRASVAPRALTLTFDPGRGRLRVPPRRGVPENGANVANAARASAGTFTAGALLERRERRGCTRDRIEDAGEERRGVGSEPGRTELHAQGGEPRDRLVTGKAVTAGHARRVGRGASPSLTL